MTLTDERRLSDYYAKSFILCSGIVPFNQETVAAQTYIVTTMRLAAEYLTKKDYVDNWASEMYEEFAFWSFANCKATLRQIGFVVKQASHVYTNKWISKTR